MLPAAKSTKQWWQFILILELNSDVGAGVGSWQSAHLHVDALGSSPSTINFIHSLVKLPVKSFIYLELKLEGNFNMLKWINIHFHIVLSIAYTKV